MRVCDRIIKEMLYDSFDWNRLSHSISIRLESHRMTAYTVMLLTDTDKPTNTQTSS